MKRLTNLVVNGCSTLSLLAASAVIAGGGSPFDADLNGDQTVDNQDTALVFEDWGEMDSPADVFGGDPTDGPTSSGFVDIDDANFVQSFFGTSLVEAGDSLFSLHGVDLGGDPTVEGALKGSPIEVSGTGFYFDPFAASDIYAPSSGDIEKTASLEFTSYVAIGSGPSTASFTPTVPDLSTPGFSSTSGHFDIPGQVRGAWYHNGGVPSAISVPGGGQGVHVARLSIVRGESFSVGDSVVRVLVEFFGTTYTVAIPLGEGAVVNDVFGEQLPAALEARAVLAASPDGVGDSEVDLDVYDIYVAEATAIIVDMNGEEDFTSIQAAIDSVTGGETIIVSPGTYFEAIDTLGMPMFLRSMDPDDTSNVAMTIIDGSAKETVVTCANGEGVDTVISGFTIQNGNGAAGGGISCVNASPLFEKCVITSNNATNGGGLRTLLADPLFIDCVFIDNDATSNGGAAHNSQDSSPYFEGCRFLGNNADASGGAIFNSESEPAVIGCEFSGNNAMTSGGAIANELQSDAAIINSTFANNATLFAQGAIYNNQQSSPIIANCIFWANTPGAIENGSSGPNNPVVTYSLVQGGFAGIGNISGDPLFEDDFGPDAMVGTLDDNFNLMPGSPAIDAGINVSVPLTLDQDIDGDDRFSDDPATTDTGVGTAPIVDMGSQEFIGPETLLVDQGGMGDFTTIQAAVDAADDGATININTGTYLLGAPVDLGTKNLVIQANPNVGTGTSANVILDGNDTHQLMRITGGQTNATQIRGLIFERGLAAGGGALKILDSSPRIIDSLFNANGSSSNGGAVYSGNGNPSFESCTFTGNAAATFGGAVYVEDAASFDSCEFSNANIAQAGGALAYENATGSCFNSTFIGNTADFGAATNGFGGSAFSFDSCTFRINSASAGGAYFGDSSSDTFNRCRFQNNSATMSGGVTYSGETGGPTFTNCLMYENSAGVNGGVCAGSDTSSPNFINCTIADNTATGLGGAIFADTMSTPNIFNSILWGNSGSQIVGAAVDASFSIVESGFPGDGNLSEDPLFVDASDDDYGIATNSPAIDAASNAEVFGTIDFIGSTRRVDDAGTVDTGIGSAPIVDMGAFEFQGTSFDDCDNDGVMDDTDLMPNVQNGVFPVGIFANTTGGPDSRFTGAPDGSSFGLGNGTVIYELRGFRLVNGEGPDFNVYSDDALTPEFQNIAVSVSADGESFFSVTASEGPAIDLPGDDGHSVEAARRSYDIDATELEEVRFIAVIGTLGAQLGSAAGFDLDSVGLINSRELDSNNNGVIDECELGTVFVDANADGAEDGLSWSGAFTGLQDALDLVASDGSNGVQIFVAQGTYVPNTSQELGFDFGATFSIPNGAHLIGGFSGDGTETDPSQADPDANLTILSGDVNGDDGANFTNRVDNRAHVVTFDEGVSGTLEGFRIRGGNAAGEGFPGGTGGGILTVGSQARIVNCVIEDNQASADGGGIFTLNTNVGLNKSEPLIVSGSVIQNNVAGDDGGGIYSSDNAVLVTASMLIGNTADDLGGAINVRRGLLIIETSDFESNDAGESGGAIASVDSNLDILDALFLDNSTGNEGGAISLEGALSAGIVSTIFDGNTSEDQGGAMFLRIPSGSIDIADCSFIANAADSEGGVCYIAEPFEEERGARGGSSVRFVQSVFAGNSADFTGAAIENVSNGTTSLIVTQSSFAGHSGANEVIRSQDALDIQNTAMWDNNGLIDIVAFGFNNTIEYSIFQSLAFPDEEFLTEESRGGNNTDENIQQDPLFVDVPGGDLSIMMGSPAIDAGDTTLVDDNSDFLGNTRVVDDTGTPDTGRPADERGNGGPVVDIGAYEFQGTSMQMSTFPFDTEILEIDSFGIGQEHALTDLDGDGDIDVIASYQSKGNEVVWYENSRGSFEDADFNTVEFPDGQPTDLDAGDVDGDGDIDVLIASASEISIASNNGQPSPNFSGSNIAPGIQDVRSARLGDLDNDGDLDVVVGRASGGGSSLLWYENTAGNAFGAFDEHSIEGGSGSFIGVNVGDMDRDGNLDIIGIDANPDTISVYFNNGDSTFTSRFVYDNLVIFGDNAPGIADIDGDSVNDIVFAKRAAEPNLGLGFSQLRIAFMRPDRNATVLTVSELPSDVDNVAIGDYDSDGDLDIIATIQGDRSTYWFENQGDRTFERHLAYTQQGSGSSSVVSGDMDLDGDHDLVVIEPSFGSIYALENRFIHRAPDYPFGRVLAREGNGITSTDYADMDGDGDLDLISGSFFDDRVLWYENPGVIAAEWTVHEPTAQVVDGVTSVHAVDYDRDGDMDIAVSGILSNDVTIYLNDIPNAGDLTALTPFDSFGPVLGANDVRSGDFNGDGLPDLLASAAASGEILLRFNPGTGAIVDNGILLTIVSDVATGVRAAVPADIDGDGDLDVLSAENGAGAVRWYDNTGSGDGTTWEANFVDSEAGAPNDIAAADLDNDGDMDAVVADFGDNRLVWYENESNGQFWTYHLIASGLGGPSGVAICDVNSDGFMDIAVANRFSNTVRYYINSRPIGPFDSLSFEEADDSPVSTTAQGVQSVGGADLDRDGRCDWFAGTFAGDAMIVYRNRGGQFRATGFETVNDTVFAADTSDIFTFTFDHLGLDNEFDGGARITSMDMLILDGAGDPMGPSTAELVFESIEIVAPSLGLGQLGDITEGITIGEITEFSNIENGILPVPIETQSLAPNISPQGSGDYIIRVTLLDTASEIFPNGFTIQFTDEANVNANHLEFDDGELEEQGDPTFSTGLIEVLKEQMNLCTSDCDGSGTVDFTDLVCILFLFGENGGPGDADGSGLVNFSDLITVLFQFGPCP